MFLFVMVIVSIIYLMLIVNILTGPQMYTIASDFNKGELIDGKYYGGNFTKKGRKDIYYYIEPSTIDPTFVEKVDKILQSEDWRDFRVFKDTDSNYDVVLKLTPRKDMIKMPKEYYDNGELISFSVTVTGPGTRPTTYFDDVNWLKGAKPVHDKQMTLEEYQSYVVKHEFLHLLGFGHSVCKDGICPISYQCTRGKPKDCQESKFATKISDRDFENKL